MRACSAAQHRERTGMQLHFAESGRSRGFESCQNGTYTCVRHLYGNYHIQEVASPFGR